MKAEAIPTSSTEMKTPCGRCGCIIFYKGELCIFCEAATEMLADALMGFGVSSSAICEIDVDSEEECGCGTDDIAMLPTIRICDMKLTGLPDEQSMNDAVMRAIMRDCFCE
ncbi:MAG: hypothetical protein ACFFE6_03985 [Candidatus Thorarchaeota archaeon]